MAAKSRSSADATAPVRSDAYVGILLISLLAQITAVLFFYLDWSQYPTTKPKQPPTIQAPAAAPPTGAPGGAPR